MSGTKAMMHRHLAQDDQTPLGQAGPSFHEAEIDTTIPSQPSRGMQTVRFLQHFGVMLLAMLVGMAMFDVVNGAILVPMGFVYLSDSPEASALAMAISMTVPMVAWMRIRKHAWRLNAEMAGVMIVPTVLLIAISALGLLPRT